MKTTIKLLSTILLAAACNHPSNTEGGEKTKANVTSDVQFSPPQVSEAPSLYEKKDESGSGNTALSFNGATMSFSATDSNLTSQWGTNRNGFMSSTAAVEDKKDTARKFIRTADMKFRVKNMLEATYSIENIVKQYGGFVTHTALSSNIDNKTTTAVSTDSSVETIFYTVTNDMILRVPNTKLDTALKTISVLIDYLDYRTINAEDIALRLLENKLARDRALKGSKRITAAIDDQGRKLRETTSAEELLMQTLEQADASLIANLALKDKIDFSTITLNIYQRQTVKRDLVSNHKNIDGYRPGFGTRIVEALKFGWDILESILVFIGQIWSLLVLGLAAYALYWLWRPRKN